MKNFALVVLLLLCACGQDKSLDSDPELDYYLGLYLRLAPNQGKLDELDSLHFVTSLPDSPYGGPQYGLCTISRDTIGPKRLRKMLTSPPWLCMSLHTACMTWNTITMKIRLCIITS